MLKLFAFQSKATQDRAIYPAESSTDAFLHFISDVSAMYYASEDKVALLEKFELIPQEVKEV